MAIFTNISGTKTVRNAFYKYSNNIKTLNIVSAFFSYPDILEELAQKDIQINLIVRLSPVTSADSLLRLEKYENICIRIYTTDSFHPKLYIFGDNLALLGSANMTNKGFNSNSEICVTIDREEREDEFDELVSIFDFYWQTAKVFNKNDIKEYKKLLTKHKNPNSNTAEKSIIEKFGKIAPPSQIVNNNKKKKTSEVYIEDYDRKYQEFLRSYNKVAKIYSSMNKRKVQETVLPIRIEIDQFFSYICSSLVESESNNYLPVKTGKEFNLFVKNVAEKWILAEFPYIDIISQNYSKISKNFESAQSIEKLSPEKIFETLYICHSFATRMRHYGSKPIFMQTFLEKNKEKQIKTTIKYLLFGEDKITTRMAKCIFGEYKLEHMGRANVQELIGWVNHEDIPIYNSRTLKALKYLSAIEEKF